MTIYFLKTSPLGVLDFYFNTFIAIYTFGTSEYVENN